MAAGDTVLGTRPSRSQVLGARSAGPKNTTDGYAVDWKDWERFTALLGLPVTAIPPSSLTAFVEWLWFELGWKKGPSTAPSTIDRRLSGVVVTGRTDHKRQLDKTVAAHARRILKVKVKKMDRRRLG